MESLLGIYSAQRFYLGPAHLPRQLQDSKQATKIWLKKKVTRRCCLMADRQLGGNLLGNKRRAFKKDVAKWRHLEERENNDRKCTLDMAYYYYIYLSLSPSLGCREETVPVVIDEPTRHPVTSWPLQTSSFVCLNRLPRFVVGKCF